MKSLLPRQELFCLEYLKDLNADAAAERAGYKPRTGSVMFAQERIRARIDELMKYRWRKVEVEGETILQELMKIGLSDVRDMYDENGCILPPKEWPESIARCISSIEVEKLFEGTGRDRKQVGTTTKVKLWNKVQCLELLGKHKSLFTDKMEITGKITLESLVAAGYVIPAPPTEPRNVVSEVSDPKKVDPAK